MKFLLYSDLHLEVANYRPPLSLLDSNPPDCVVLAGDIGTGLMAMPWAQKYFTARDIPVLYVAGNHEFWGKDYATHYQDLYESGKKHGVTFLQNESVTIKDVRFIGCTLWTDYKYQQVNQHLGMIQAIKGMNDYHRIENNGRKLSPADLLTSHENSVAYIKSQLTQKDYPNVVITHMGPSKLSIDPKFDGDPYNHCYISQLDDIMYYQAPRYWVHGHVHSTFHYFVESTEVVTNPRGYFGYEHNPTFDDYLLLEI